MTQCSKITCQEDMHIYPVALYLWLNRIREPHFENPGVGQGESGRRTGHREGQLSVSIRSKIIRRDREVIRPEAL